MEVTKQLKWFSLWLHNRLWVLVHFSAFTTLTYYSRHRVYWLPRPRRRVWARRRLWAVGAKGSSTLCLSLHEIHAGASDIELICGRIEFKMMQIPVVQFDRNWRRVTACRVPPSARRQVPILVRVGVGRVPAWGLVDRNVVDRRRPAGCTSNAWDPRVVRLLASHVARISIRRQHTGLTIVRWAHPHTSKYFARRSWQRICNRICAGSRSNSISIYEYLISVATAETSSKSNTGHHMQKRSAIMTWRAAVKHPIIKKIFWHTD